MGVIAQAARKQEDAGAQNSRRRRVENSHASRLAGQRHSHAHTHVAVLREKIQLQNDCKIAPRTATGHVHHSPAVQMQHKY
jgi:hypothetical protein